MNLIKKLIAAFYKDILELRAAVSEVNTSDDSTQSADKVQPPSMVDRKSRQLHEDLSALHCSEGLRQLHGLQHKYRNFHAVLSRQLNPTEVTFARYATVAEQVYLAALDNLDAAVVALQSISAVDVSGLQTRLAQPDDSIASGDEKNALRRRLATWEEQTSRVTQWLAQNENALTTLDRAAAKLAAIPTSRGRAAVGLDTAMAELERLAQRAHRYALDSDR